MLAGYEDRPHLIPASGRPPCGSVSAAGRRLYIAPACGRASVPYPGVRPRKRGRPAHALLACAAGLRRHLIPCERGEPAAVPYPGVRPCKRGRPAAVPYPGLRPPAMGARTSFLFGEFLPYLKNEISPKALILEIRLLNYTPSGGKLSLTD